MSMTDPIADMLTRIRNAGMVAHETVDVPASKLKVQLAKLLKEEGFISDYEVKEEGKGISSNHEREGEGKIVYLTFKIRILHG